MFSLPPVAQISRLIQAKDLILSRSTHILEASSSQSSCFLGCSLDKSAISLYSTPAIELTPSGFERMEESVLQPWPKRFNHSWFASAYFEETGYSQKFISLSGADTMYLPAWNSTTGAINRENIIVGRYVPRDKIYRLRMWRDNEFLKDWSYDVAGFREDEMSVKLAMNDDFVAVLTVLGAEMQVVLLNTADASVCSKGTFKTEPLQRIKYLNLTSTHLLVQMGDDHLETLSCFSLSSIKVDNILENSAKVDHDLVQILPKGSDLVAVGVAEDESRLLISYYDTEGSTAGILSFSLDGRDGGEASRHETRISAKRDQIINDKIIWVFKSASDVCLVQSVRPDTSVNDQEQRLLTSFTSIHNPWYVECPMLDKGDGFEVSGFIDFDNESF